MDYSYLTKMLIEKRYRPFPGQFGHYFVVAACGIVVKTMISLRIHVHGELDFVRF